MKVCIIGASGKLGRCMVQHSLDGGYEVVGVCRERSVGKLDEFKGRIALVPGATNNREVIKKAVGECDGILTVLVSWGVQNYSSGTVQAVMSSFTKHRHLSAASLHRHRPMQRMQGCRPAANR